MKKTLLATVLSLGLFSVPLAHAADPCETLVCMAGLAGVAGGSVAGGCDSAINSFFDIRKFRKGKFKASATSSARKSFIKSCSGSTATAISGSNPAAISAIISKFGRRYSL